MHNQDSSQGSDSTAGQCPPIGELPAGPLTELEFEFVAFLPESPWPHLKAFMFLLLLLSIGGGYPLLKNQFD